MKLAQQEVGRAEAVLKRNKREAVPDLNLRAGEQQNFEELSGTSKSVGAQSFATATIQIPLFNRNQGNVDAAKAELERDQQEVSRIKLALAQSAQPLLQQYLTTKLEAERYRTQMIPRAQRAYELYLHKYQSMAAAYPEVIISQRTLFQLQESYVQSLGELWASAVQLQNYLLADGMSAPFCRWKPEPGDKSAEQRIGKSRVTLKTAHERVCGRTFPHRDCYVRGVSLWRFVLAWGSRSLAGHWLWCPLTHNANLLEG